MNGFRAWTALGMLVACTSVLVLVGLAIAPADSPDLPAPIVVGLAGVHNDDPGDLRRQSRSRLEQAGDSGSNELADEARIVVADPILLRGTVEQAHDPAGQDGTPETVHDPGSEQMGSIGGTPGTAGSSGPTPTTAPTAPSLPVTSPPSASHPVEQGPHEGTSVTDGQPASQHQGEVTAGPERSNDSGSGMHRD